jgi:hypothetical protein
LTTVNIEYNLELERAFMIVAWRCLFIGRHSAMQTVKLQRTAQSTAHNVTAALNPYMDCGHNICPHTAAAVGGAMRMRLVQHVAANLQIDLRRPEQRIRR